MRELTKEEEYEEHSNNTIPEFIVTTIDVPRCEPIKHNTINTQVQGRGVDGDEELVRCAGPNGM